MKTFFLSVAALLLTVAVYGQKVYQIRADSVRIYNVCDTAELILENRTQNVKGFLFNKGAGRTEFQKLKLQAIGTSRIAISGQDTLDLSALPGIGSGVDTIYTFADSIRYTKSGKVYAFRIPPAFITVPDGGSNPYTDYKDKMLTGFFAYSSLDMPPISDQAQVNPSTGSSFYIGHALRSGAYGYQMAVNWDGETFGPKGAFLRVKDDTNLTGWGAWRELLFKDYADNKYALLSNTYTKTNLATPGAAQVAWGNIINVPVLAEQDNLESVLTRGNRSLKPMGVHQVYSEGAPTISLAVGDYDSGINAVNDGTLTLISNGIEVARWASNMFNVKGSLTVNNNDVWHRGNDNLLLRDRGVITLANIDNVGGINGTYRVEATGFSYNLLNFSNSGSTGTFQLLASYSGTLQYRNKTDENSWNAWKNIWTDKNDGIGSGLDADLLRGKSSSPNPDASTVAERDANGYLFAKYFNTAAAIETSTPVKLFGSFDNYIRPYDANTVRTFLGIPASGETLQSVTDRGNVTTKLITTGGISFNGNNGRFDGVHLDLHSGDNSNIRFWDGSEGYFIGMKSTAGSGYTNVTAAANNDFNMYFRMNDNNRGFVFVTGNNTAQAQIDNTGLTVKDWLRVRGQGGLYFQDYGGGWNMIDNVWVRVYGGKSVYQETGKLRTDGILQVGSEGATMNVPAGGTPTINGNVIFHAGNLLYSTTSTPNYLVQRDASGNVYANGFYQSSKASLKKNIADFSESALPLINQVKIKQFVYKDDKDENTRIGIIADSTDWHFSTKAHDKFDTNSSLAITMKAVQELSTQNQELKNENEMLKKQMLEIVKKMEELEKKLTK